MLGKTVDVLIHCDSESALYLMKNSMYHERTKHTDIKLHFIREVITCGKVAVTNIASKKNAAYALTKILSKEQFEKCMGFVQVKDKPPDKDNE